MKMVNAKLLIKLNFVENKVNVLILENPDDMTYAINELFRQNNGEDGDFIFSDDLNEIDIQKDIDFVLSPFNICLNSNKIKKALYKKLEIEAETDFYENKHIINQNLMNILEKICFTYVNEDVEYNFDFDWISLFKLYDVKFRDDFEYLHEKIIAYIKIVNELLGVELFVFTHLHDYLNTEQLKNLYEIANYMKIKLLIIESVENEKIKDENIYILDKDGCVIIK